MCKSYLSEKGIAFKSAPRPESIEHAFWKYKASLYYAGLGYKATIEKAINGFTDLVLEKESDKIAVEIETGKSDWRKNIQKNIERGFQKIILIATNESIYTKLQNSLGKEIMRFFVEIYQAKDIL